MPPLTTPSLVSWSLLELSFWVPLLQPWVWYPEHPWVRAGELSPSGTLGYLGVAAEVGALLSSCNCHFLEHVLCRHCAEPFYVHRLVLMAALEGKGIIVPV